MIIIFDINSHFIICYKNIFGIYFVYFFLHNLSEKQSKKMIVLVLNMGGIRS